MKKKIEAENKADPGLNQFSSDSDPDYDDDAEEVKVATHKFVIDLIARYPNLEDNLVLHWGISRK